MGKGEAKRRQIDAFADIIMLFGMLILKKRTGGNGLAYLFAAYILYDFFWILCGKGQAAVIARLMKGRGIRTRYKNSFAIKSRIVLVQLLSGMIGSVLLFFFGVLMMDKIWGIQGGVSVVMILVPALLLRNVEEGYSGFVRGAGKELPVAAVTVLRSILFIVLSLLISSSLRGYGEKVGALLMQERTPGMYAAIGVSITANVTEVLCLILLFLLDKLFPQKSTDGTRMAEPMGELFVNLFFGRLENVLTGLLLVFPLLSGTCVYCIQKKSESGFVNELGAFIGSFLIAIFIVLKFLDLIVLPVTARMKTYNKKTDLRLERTIFEYGVHGICVWGLFFSMILMALSKEWAELVNGVEGADISRLFMLGAAVILFAGLADYFSRMLSILDRRMLLLGNLGIMNVVFVVAMAIAIRQTERSFEAVIFSMILAVGVLCFSSAVSVMRVTGINVDWLHNAGIPAAAVLVTGILIYFLARIIVPHMGSLVTVVLTTALGLFLYLTILLLMRNLREPEYTYFPGGKIAGFLGRLFSV